MWSSLRDNKLPVYMSFLQFSILGFSLFFLSGCGLLSYNTATGHNEFIFISTNEEVAMGRQIHTALMKENKICSNPEYTARVQKVGERVALVSDRQDYQYKFFVIESDEINAFTIPGGNIYFYTGLLKKLSTDDEVAAVLAHEIGHCAARHTIKKYQAALGYSLIGNIVLDTLTAETQTKRLLAMSSDALMSLVSSAYSRHDEIEADKLGVKYLFLSGYDPQGMVQTLEVLQKETEGKSKTPLIFRSHPYAKDRIVETQKEIDKLKQEFEVKP